MKDIPRITSAEVVIHGILKIEWNDGYVGVVDLWPVISRGKIFAYLQDAESFRDFQIGEYGHALVWTNQNGEEIDFWFRFATPACRKAVGTPSSSGLIQSRLVRLG